MPVIEKITLTHNELVEVSQKMFERLNKTLSQGTLETVLFQAIGDVKSVDMFVLRPDECTCGDKKDPNALMCPGCERYNH